MDLDHVWAAMGDALHGVDLTILHDIPGLVDTLSSAGVDLSGMTNEQLDYVLQHMVHGHQPLGQVLFGALDNFGRPFHSSSGEYYLPYE